MKKTTLEVRGSKVRKRTAGSKHTKQNKCSESAREGREDEFLLRDQDLTCIPSQPRDEGPA